MTFNKQQLIEFFQLEPHIEGGYFRRTFQSERRVRIQDTSGHDADHRSEHLGTAHSAGQHLGTAHSAGQHLGTAHSADQHLGTAHSADQHLGGEHERYLMTSIFYLLTDDSNIGHWHTDRSDIIHYFHAGGPIDYYLIHPDGQLTHTVMGPDLSSGHKLQLIVPGGTWKASHLPVGEYGLISEAVAPGFDYQDMTIGIQAELTAQFPQHRALIEKFIRVTE